MEATPTVDIAILSCILLMYTGLIGFCAVSLWNKRQLLRTPRHPEHCVPIIWAWIGLALIYGLLSGLFSWLHYQGTCCSLFECAPCALSRFVAVELLYSSQDVLIVLPIGMLICLAHGVAASLFVWCCDRRACSGHQTDTAKVIPFRRKRQQAALSPSGLSVTHYRSTEPQRRARAG